MAKTEDSKQTAQTQNTGTNWAKAFQFSPDITKSETLDFVFWLRQLIGLSIGLVAGFLQLEGMFVILGFFVVMFVLSNMYAYKMLNVNEDDFANNELMMEGIGNSAGVFFLTWIMGYTYL